MIEEVIKRMFLIIVLLFVLSAVNYSQQEIEVPKDTILRYQGFTPSLIYKFDELISYDDPSFFIYNLPSYNNSSTIWLRTGLALSSSLLYKDETETHQHFTSILHKQYLEDSKFDPVRYVLGMAQLGAVGYLVYRRIKKFGFR